MYSIVFFILFLFFLFYTKSKTFQIIGLFFTFIFLLITLFNYTLYNYTGNFLNISIINLILVSLSDAPLLSFWKNICLIVLFILAIVLFCIILYKKLCSYNKYLKFAEVFCLLFICLAVYFNPLTKSLVEIYQFFNPEFHPKISENLEKSLSKPKILNTNFNKNIVYIYLESFSRNFIANYKELTPNLNSFDNRLDFININQIPQGAGITIEGMFASQCGLPYFLTKYGKKNDNGGVDLENAKPKFPKSNIICAPDVLQKLGYHTYFIKGADLGFQNTDMFLKSRNYDEMYGKKELIKRGAKNINSWGVDDDELFNFAFEDFIKMSEKKDKFLQVILNVSMHVPDGFVSKKCNELLGLSSNEMLDAVKCTDFLLGEFINKIRSSKYSKNTIIAIQNDHLMPYMVANGVDSKKIENSKMLFMILDDSINGVKVIENYGSSLDTFTTFLGYIGVTDEMNLGRNILNKDSIDKSEGNIQMLYKAAMGGLLSIKYKK